MVATLHERFDPRRNSVDLLRLTFAGLVATAHGVVLHTGTQPQWGRSTLGAFGVDAFFVLSGFLVTRSYLQSASVARFAWHRFLRIMPGFWVCLLVVAFVGAPVAALLRGLAPAVAFTGEPSALRYVLGNAGLLVTQYDIAGILSANPRPMSFNGALWTLAFEAACYLIVAVLGVAGVLARRRFVVVAAVGTLAVLTALQELGVPVPVNDRILRLLFVFLLGAAAYLYADRIPMHWGLAAAAAVVFLISVASFQNYRVLGAAPLAYVLLWFGACFRWPWSMRTDLSYGLYIYHWPLFQILFLTGVGTLWTLLFVPIGLTLALGVAWLSWRLVEEPALRHKRSALPDRVTAALTGKST